MALRPPHIAMQDLMQLQFMYPRVTSSEACKRLLNDNYVSLLTWWWKCNATATPAAGLSPDIYHKDLNPTLAKQCWACCIRLKACQCFPHTLNDSSSTPSFLIGNCSLQKASASLPLRCSKCGSEGRKCCLVWQHSPLKADLTCRASYESGPLCPDWSKVLCKPRNRKEQPWVPLPPHFHWVAEELARTCLCVQHAACCRILSVPSTIATASDACTQCW